jgi:hypothetical protein
MYQQVFWNNCSRSITLHVHTDSDDVTVFVPQHGHGRISCDAPAGCHSISGYNEECDDLRQSSDGEVVVPAKSRPDDETLSPKRDNTSRVPPVDGGQEEMDQLLKDLQPREPEQNPTEGKLEEMHREILNTAQKTAAKAYSRGDKIEKKELARRAELAKRERIIRLQEERLQLERELQLQRERQAMIKRQIEIDRSRNEMQHQDNSQAVINAFMGALGGVIANQRGGPPAVRRNQPTSYGSGPSNCGTGRAAACK